MVPGLKAGVCALAAPAILALCAALAAPALAGDPAWPFDQPPIDTLRQSPKKVFAHYFTPFMLWHYQVSGRCPAASPDCGDDGAHDVYQDYLSGRGADDVHLAVGGYLRERPLPAAATPANDPAWELHNAEEEVRRASALGLDGFAVDILWDQGESPDQDWHRVKVLLQAAAEVDPDAPGHTGFKIMLMPDMDTQWTESPARLAKGIATLSAYSSVYRVPACEHTDRHPAANCLVVAPYDAARRSGAWWADWKRQMQAQGLDVALLPVFLEWWKYADSRLGYAPLAYGYSDWGTASFLQQASWLTMSAQAHKLGIPLWMGTVRPQDSRPKDLSPPTYFESVNSRVFRETWGNAISGGADWVQIATWNDYSEHTEIAPSTRTQYGFYDLTAYYTSWFKSGVQPAITRDVLYYFHRRHSSAAVPSQVAAANRFELRHPALDTAVDQIELLAFLTAPGTLRISAGGTVLADKAVVNVAAGGSIVSLAAPLPAAASPTRLSFSLIRNGKTVTSVTSPSPVCDRIGYQDLLYQAGSSSRAPVPGIADGCGSY